MISLLGSRGQPGKGSGQVQELIRKKQEILRSRVDNYRLERDKGSLKYEDLFIDSESAEVKFYSDQALVELCSQRLALAGKNILLTPDNLTLPRSGLRELKQLLTRSQGTLLDDMAITITFKSEHKFGKG